MLVRSGLFIFALLLTPVVQASELNSELAQAEHRALFNYQMFCQGCHSADGSGHKSVPQLKNSMNKFMASQQGREYLIRVPGAANSVLDDEQLTELMNWMLRNFTDSSNAPTWKPYEVHEISEHRQSPLYETVEYRRNLIANLELEPDL
ncbi:MAG: cytochrome c553 [Arenicella sp.]|jgi:cytochrome c553